MEVESTEQWIEKTNQYFAEYLNGITKVENQVACIDELIKNLQYMRRLALLTPEERKDLLEVSLSPEATKRLDGAKTKTERDELFSMYARSAYIRRCEWEKYLNGETPNKPLTSKAVEPAANNG